MGLENRRSGNASEGSNPSLSANSPANATVSDGRKTRRSIPVPADADGAKVGTVYAYRTRLRPVGHGTIPRNLNWHWIETPANGSIDRDDIPRSAWRYGVFGCDRPLTAQELADFEIELVAPAPVSPTRLNGASHV